jgi:hypothetical protein
MEDLLKKKKKKFAVFDPVSKYYKEHDKLIDAALDWAMNGGSRSAILVDKDHWIDPSEPFSDLKKMIDALRLEHETLKRVQAGQSWW